MARAKPAHRTHEERRAETRQRILDAAVECLVEHGWAGTTMARAAERSGVSRGAQQYHFPSRSELVAAAVQHLAAQLTEVFVKAFARVPPQDHPIGAAIDTLWEVYRDPRVPVILELTAAARTDEELRASLRPVLLDFQATIRRLGSESFGPELAGHPSFPRALDFTFDVLQGLLARALVQPDDPAIETSLQLLKESMVALSASEGPGLP